MKAKIKSIYNPEVDNVADYIPPEKDNFCILFRTMIGPEDEPGEESFDIQVCAPLWLSSTLKPGEVISKQS